MHLIVDGHEDLATNAIALKRDLLKPISEIRAEPDLNPKEGIPTVSFPELRKGNVRIIFATLWAAPCGTQDISPGPCYSTPEEAHMQGMEQLNYYKQLADRGVVKIIKNKSDLQSVENSDNQIGLVILMEGADPVRTPSEVSEWFNAGVRIIGPAWGQTRYSGGTKAPGPLSEIGKELVAEMEKAGMILDISHMAEQSFYDALDSFHGTLIASHSNSRVYTMTDRHLTDEMIKAIVLRDGVIGTVLYNKFLDPDWEIRGKVKSEVTFETVVKHIKRVCDIAGDRLHSGIGSDLDGGFGRESTPEEIDTVADIQKIDAELAKASFTEEDIENIKGGNWLRLLKRGLPD